MGIFRIAKVSIAVALASALGFGSTWQAADAAEKQGLFVGLSGLDRAQDKDAAVDPTAFRSRFVSINWDMMDLSSQDQATGAGILVLNLFEDTIFSAVLDRRENRSGKSFTWIGYVEGVPDSQVTLVVEDAGVMVGNIRVSDAYFQVRYVGSELHVVRQIDETRFPPDGEPIPADIPASKTAQDLGTTATDNASTFDVMVVYTPAARAAAGGTTAMSALINLAVAETNTAYSRSGVIPRVRLVHRAEVSYTEAPDLPDGSGFVTDLNRLTNPSDGFMDNVHALRNTHGADLVSLFIQGTALCGIAWLMTTESNAFEAFAFSVVEQSCATGNYTFGHEMGHNMGLRHDRIADNNPGVFPHSHGYVDVPNNFRDIMGVAASCNNTCPRIQNFSNPNVTFNGHPTGVPQGSPNSADAAASLNATALTVANWRTQIVPKSPVDFDGDGKSDVGVYRSGAWSVLRSSDGGNTVVGWGGAAQDIPVPADYDGDGKADVAIYRSGAWSILRSSDGGNTVVGWGGAAQDILVPADYDGDGRADVAIYRDGAWSILRSSDGGNTVVGWGGAAQDQLVPADYDGDGKVDIAIYRDGAWSILRSSDGGNTVVGWGGAAQDILVPADYDGDGKADIAIYRDGAWIIKRSSDGGTMLVGWGGAAEDIPLN